MSKFDLDEVEKVRKLLSVYPTSTILLALIADYTNDSLSTVPESPESDFADKAVVILTDALAGFRALYGTT